MTPTLVTSCTALPPEGAARLRPGEAGSVALAVKPLRLLALRSALPPEGAARLRPGEAGSVALSCTASVTALFVAWVAMRGADGFFYALPGDAP